MVVWYYGSLLLRYVWSVAMVCVVCCYCMCGLLLQYVRSVATVICRYGMCGLFVWYVWSVATVVCCYSTCGLLLRYVWSVATEQLQCPLE
jgi:hypothetical protein